MPQLTEISVAVSAAMAMLFGERIAALKSAVRPAQTSTHAAIGTDQTMRCEITSISGRCATAFMQEHRRLGALCARALPIDPVAVADIEHAALEWLDLGIERTQGTAVDRHSFKPCCGQLAVS